MVEYRLHGPPGTGKTRALAESWVPRAAQRFGSDRVVICSLTRPAASEIASRGIPIPEHNIGTLHALAFRALGRPTIAEGKIDSWNEAEGAFQITGSGPSVDEPEIRSERGTRGDELSALAQVYRHRRIPRSQWRDDVLVFQNKWERWMGREGLTDFTGLIEDALETVPTAPGDPAVFIVDEAQDSSTLELDLVRKWASRAEDGAVLAGDGDQAIYGWRGASARAFLTPEIPAENNYHLTKSYRVPRAVHAVASRWIEQASYRYAVEYEPRDFEGLILESRGGVRNPFPILQGAIEDMEAGKSVMILAACGFMLHGIIKALRHEGVPFHNPYRPTHGGWNPLRGGGRRLGDYLRPDPSTYPSTFRMWNWEEAKSWTDVIRARESLATGGKAWIHRMSKDNEERAKPIAPEDGRVVFGDSWEELQTAFAEGAPLPWLRERLLPSKRKLMEYAFTIAEKRGTLALRNRPSITVGTIHSTKGGQADAVYLLPDLSASGMREFTKPGDGRDGIIRTFYVGMTRAKEKLVVGRRQSPCSLALR